MLVNNFIFYLEPVNFVSFTKLTHMKKFILFGTQRTGSSALAELIGLHPDIACGWEWKQRIPRNRKILAVEMALSGDFSYIPGEEVEVHASTL